MSEGTHMIPDEWLMAYRDGELDDARRARVAAHLGECADCRQALAELGALSQALLRWSPGIGLLLLNGVVQVLALALTGLLLLPMALVQAVAWTPAWATGLVQLAAGATLGWLAWLVPDGLSGWVLIGVWLIVSAELALLYVAWLGYELRHGPLTTFGRAAA